MAATPPRIAPALGSFTYNRGTDSVVLNWPEEGQGKLADVLASTESLRNTLNTKNLNDPNDPASGPFDVFATTTFTAHPVGGAVLGRACNDYGRVKGQARLFVVDGAMVPVGSLGCNPSLTIAALAERNMEQIIEKDIHGPGPGPSSLFGNY